MKNQWVLASALAMLVTACGAKEWDGEQVAKDVVNYMDDKIRGRPYEPVRGKQPELIVTHEGLVLDGKQLRLGAPVEEWLAVLGPPDLMSQDGFAMNWDRLGIHVFAPDSYFELNPLNGRPFVLSVTVHTQQGHRVPGTYDIPDPKGTFPGYLQFDGFGIDARTTEQDIMRFNRRSERPYRYRCIGEELRSSEASRKLSSTLPPQGMREYVLFGVVFSFDEAPVKKVQSVAFGISGHQSPSFEPEIEDF